MDLRCRAQMINIAGKVVYLGFSVDHKTCASEYHAIKQQIADERRERRRMRKFSKEKQLSLVA